MALTREPAPLDMVDEAHGSGPAPPCRAPPRAPARSARRSRPPMATAPSTASSRAHPGPGRSNRSTASATARRSTPWGRPAALDGAPMLVNRREEQRVAASDPLDGRDQASGSRSTSPCRVQSAACSAIAGSEASVQLHEASLPPAPPRIQARSATKSTASAPNGAAIPSAYLQRGRSSAATGHTTSAQAKTSAGNTTLASLAPIASAQAMSEMIHRCQRGFSCSNRGSVTSARSISIPAASMS